MRVPTDAPARTASPSTTIALENEEETAEPIGSIRFVPHIEFSSRLSLNFEPMERKAINDNRLKIGRFNDKSQNRSSVTFKSKVVSRLHAELWCSEGNWYIKDTKSSSGTFVNHVRLSPPGQESKPTILTDGDAVQFGIDFRGGTEEVYRCVRTRVEINRIFQQNIDKYNRAAHKRLVNLTMADGPNTPTTEAGQTINDTASAYSAECCICLFAIAPSQALFVAPCSHAYHFKCIRPLLSQNYPNFLCCVCRKYADLEASVEVESEAWIASQSKEQDPRTPTAEIPEPVYQSIDAPMSSAIPDEELETPETPSRKEPDGSVAIVNRQLRDLTVESDNTPRNLAGPYLVDS